MHTRDDMYNADICRETELWLSASALPMQIPLTKQIGFLHGPVRHAWEASAADQWQWQLAMTNVF